jgi:hypothetical protein
MGFIGMRLTFTGRPRSSRTRARACVLGAVVDAREERVLDGDAPPAREGVPRSAPIELGQRVPAVDGHQPRAERVVGRVQRDRQRHLAAEVLPQPLDLGDEPRGAHGHPARGEVEPVAVREEPQRARHAS